MDDRGWPKTSDIDRPFSIFNPFWSRLATQARRASETFSKSRNRSPAIRRNSRRTAGIWLLPAFAVLFVAACGRDLGTAQGVVEEFVDQHYVHIDIPKARQYAVGLALQKLDEEIRLTSGQVIDASTRKPKVNYRMLEKKEADSRASFLYEGTIQTDDGTSFTRKWLIAARKNGNQWRVSNFSESD
jgi:hypothetical protein